MYAPVSYTHLDVYKRQVCALPLVAAADRGDKGRASVFLFDVPCYLCSVSYTHLDVYKRQIYAYKCGVSKQQLRQDMKEAFDDLQMVKHENALTEEDIRLSLIHI